MNIFQTTRRKTSVGREFLQMRSVIFVAIFNVAKVEQSILMGNAFCFWKTAALYKNKQPTSLASPVCCTNYSYFHLKE